MFGQKKLAMIVAEILGTMLLSLALYTVLARTSFPIFTGLAVAGTITLLTMVFGPVSGGHFNPAVTLALWTRNKVGTLHAAVNIIAQFLGAVAAWGLIRYFMGHALTSLAGAKFTWPVFVAEAIGTAVLTFGIGAAVYMKAEGAKYASAVGLSFFLGILVASLASNAILNPAVALGIQSWDWAYATAPIVGGIIGINLYYLVFGVEWSSMTKATVTTKRPATKSTAKKKSRR